MQAPDLHDLAVQLTAKVEELKKTFSIQSSRHREVENLLDEFASKLVFAYSGLSETVRKTDKKELQRVKQCLYEVETLVCDIELLRDECGYFNQGIKLVVAGKLQLMELHLIMIKFLPLPHLFAKETVLGREYSNHKERLIEMLLNKNSSPVIPIFGRPGTGKSTLGQLVCNDPKVKEYFGHSIFNINFTYVADQDMVRRALQHDTPMRGSTTQFPPALVLFMEALRIGGKAKKCLLLVDDLSDAETLEALLSVNEKNPRFYDFLETAESGTKIIITSSLQRERENPPVMVLLQGLDDDDSWNLFRSIAVTGQLRSTDQVTVANKVCRMCGGNPSVIDIIASIMSNKRHADEWMYFHEVVMTSVHDPITTVSSILRLTELHCHHEFQKIQRQCFAWCSLLPKDYEFRKDYLLQLWKAQDVFDEAKRVRETELNSCFSEFLQSGYIIEVDTNDSVVMYKINYLASELMRYVAGDEFYISNNPTEFNLCSEQIIRHASFANVDSTWMPPSWLLNSRQLRSLLLWPLTSDGFKLSTNTEVALSGMVRLRTFHADKVHCERLPKFLFRFRRLEYLKLGTIFSISLPADIQPLGKLLDCGLQNSKGETESLRGGDSFVGPNLSVETRLAHLLKFSGFRQLTVQYGDCNQMYLLQQTDKILELLQESYRGSLSSHSTLESLEVRQWNKEILPTWAIDEFSTFIRRLRRIQIANCNSCRQIPSFNSLPNLNSLELLGLDSLVDIAVTAGPRWPYSNDIFYPSLTCLLLCDLPKFIGWSSEEVDDNHNINELYCLPLLTKVGVESCPKLISVPSMPKIEKVMVINIDSNVVNNLLCYPLIIQSTMKSEQHVSDIKYLEIDGCKDFDIEQGVWRALGGVCSLTLSNNPALVSLPRGVEFLKTLEELTLCWLANLKVLPDWIGVLKKLQRLVIRYCPKLTEFPNSSDSFNALEQLEIQYCPRLSRFPESFTNLKRLKVEEFGRLKQILRATPLLEELEIINCEELDLIVDVVVWENVGRLRILKLIKLESFPKGLDFKKLSQLSQLIIEKCPKFTEFPESFSSVSTIAELHFHFCQRLMKPPWEFSEKFPSLAVLEIEGCPQLHTTQYSRETWS